VPQSIVFRIFLDRYRYDKLGDSILTLSNVESLLNSIYQLVHSTLTPETLLTSSSDIHIAHYHLALLYQNTVHTISRGSLFSPPESVARGYTKDQIVTPLDFLSTLTSRLVSESILLNFNYVTMHQRCTRLLQALNAEFADEVEDVNRKKNSDVHSKEDPPLLRVFLAIINSFMVEAHKDKGCSRPKGVIPMMRRVEKVTKPFIEEEGDAEIEVVKRVLTDRSGLNFDTN
jgi:hypothetical protein